MDRNGDAIIEGRLYYLYSRHATETEARDALESYFAEAIVSQGEAPRVRRAGRRWGVFFRG